MELALGCEPTLALGARSLVVVGLMARVMVKKKRYRDGVRVMARVMEFDDAVAKVRNHFRCLILCQRLESTPLVLQLRQRLDARLLDSFPSTIPSTIPSTYTSPPPLHRVVQLLELDLAALGLAGWAWLDQLCGCLSRQQLRQRLEHFFCCLSRQLEHLLFCSRLSRHFLWTEPGDPPTAGSGLLAGPVRLPCRSPLAERSLLFWPFSRNNGQRSLVRFGGFDLGSLLASLPGAPPSLYLARMRLLKA